MNKIAATIYAAVTSPEDMEILRFSMICFQCRLKIDVRVFRRHLFQAAATNSPTVQANPPAHQRAQCCFVCDVAPDKGEAEQDEQSGKRVDGCLSGIAGCVCRQNGGGKRCKGFKTVCCAAWARAAAPCVCARKPRGLWLSLNRNPPAFGIRRTKAAIGRQSECTNRRKSWLTLS